MIFHYDRSRSGDVARQLLEGFHGTIVSDGYAGYEKVPDVKRALCHSHLRRKFVDSIPLDSSLKEIPGSMGAVGREKCNVLFDIEKEIKDLSPEQKFEQRQLRSRPAMEDFYHWVEETSLKTTVNEKLKEAFGYAHNQKDYLHTFLTDGRLPLSNNDCENTQRNYCVGRRNWLFADTPAGARASGILYSIVETAKANGVLLYPYFQYLLEHLPHFPFDPSDEMLERFLPWSDQLPDFCRKNTANDSDSSLI